MTHLKSKLKYTSRDHFFRSVYSTDQLETQEIKINIDHMTYVNIGNVFLNQIEKIVNSIVYMFIFDCIISGLKHPFQSDQSFIQILN